MRFTQFIVATMTLLPLLLTLNGSAFAQGDCSNPLIIGSGTYSGLVWINSSVFYSIDVPAGQFIVFTETADSNDTVYWLHDDTCSQTLSGNTGFGLGSFVWLNASSLPRTVVIEAWQFPGDFPSSGYTFTVGFSQNNCSPDAYDGNSDCANAALISGGSYQGLEMPAGISDFYQITVPQGMQVTLQETMDANDAVFWWIYSDACSEVIDASFGTPPYTWANTTEVPVLLVFEASSHYDGINLCVEYGFDLVVAPDPCQVVPDDSMENNDDCATAIPIANGAYTGLFVSTGDKDHFAFCVENGGTVEIEILQLSGLNDCPRISLREAISPYCGTGPNGGLELLAFDANCFPIVISWTNMLGADVDLVLEVAAAETDSFGSKCHDYDLMLMGSGGCGGQQVGTAFCAPMNPNSTGGSTTLSASYGSGVGSGLHLELANGPVGQFGYCLMGTAKSEPGFDLSGGRLCLDITNGEMVGRYNVAGTTLDSCGQFDASGVLQNVAGTSTIGSGFDVPSILPIPGLPPIIQGSSWHFQYWHREANGEANFSNGLSMTF